MKTVSVVGKKGDNGVLNISNDFFSVPGNSKLPVKRISKTS